MLLNTFKYEKAYPMKKQKQKQILISKSTYFKIQFCKFLNLRKIEYMKIGYYTFETMFNGTGIASLGRPGSTL